MSSVLGALCFLILLRGEATADGPETAEPIQCAEDPQTGAWMLASFVRLPEDDEDVLAARSVLWLSREEGGKYIGKSFRHVSQLRGFAYRR